ncbi:hypothetical protein SAMN04487851_11498 [Prevotella sp. tc2-28]|uniref:hypothetical protein n=1 Tax=Prevotella sp. tc2-28 TaxID=1761888 RepID=UPI000897F089|nr:hypothetical protein [Prevotella sp. tc2-28]SEA80648.1 hypothetical protein SAMN04487851_11498 [Prevotella sp. tc2-28]
MNIKDRALTAIKQNYAKFGLKAEELDKLATHIAGGLKDESTDEELNTAVEGAKFYAEMMQSVGNRKATEVQNKYKDYIPKPAEPPVPPTPPATPEGQLTIEQVQKLIEQSKADNQKAIDDAVKAATAPFLAQQEKARLNGLLMGHEKLKNIPKSFSGKYSLDKEEDLDAVATQIESDFTSFKQEMVSSGQFVEAPSPSSPQAEADDFVTAMQGFSERNAPKTQA